MRFLSALFLVLALLPFSVRAVAPPFPDRSLDPLVRDALRRWRVPGAAVVIVRDGRVIYLAGHGVVEAGRLAPVTPDTLFSLSSCTKPFTTALLAALVAEGKLDWDERVGDLLPWFRLADPLVTAEVRLRDLLCHRTGLGAHELLWHRGPWSPEEAARRARHLPLSRPFRTGLQYQSTMFAVAGLAAAAREKTTWEELIQRRLLDPLGMKAACLTTNAAKKSRALVTGHRLQLGEAVPVAPYVFREPDPACSLYANARDLGAFLKHQLASEVVAETHKPQLPIRLSQTQWSLFPDTNFISYALGWVAFDHQGLQLVSHGGAIDGVRAHFLLVPERNIGIAVLANLEQTLMPVPLAQTLLEHLLGLKKRDWHALHEKAKKRAETESLDRIRALLASRRSNTKPSRELGAYVGEYAHPAYGAVRIVLRQGRLEWRWRDENAALTHFHFDTFALASEVAGEALVAFALGGDGGVREMVVSGDRMEIAFERRKMP